jgi:hypothetical protein
MILYPFVCVSYRAVQAHDCIFRGLQRQEAAEGGEISPRHVQYAGKGKAVLVEFLEAGEGVHPTETDAAELGGGEKLGEGGGGSRVDQLQIERLTVGGEAKRGGKVPLAGGAEQGKAGDLPFGCAVFQIADPMDL